MSTNGESATRIRITVTPEQAAAIERFQTNEKLPSRTEAVRLLLEIGLDSIGGKGWRFWDDAPKE